MTVSELIAELQKYPPDLPVHLHHGTGHPCLGAELGTLEDPPEDILWIWG